MDWKLLYQFIWFRYGGSFLKFSFSGKRQGFRFKLYNFFNSFWMEIELLTGCLKLNVEGSMVDLQSNMKEKSSSFLLSRFNQSPKCDL